MLLFILMVFSEMQLLVFSQFNMFNTEIENEQIDQFCLHSYRENFVIVDVRRGRTLPRSMHEIINYCFRSSTFIKILTEPQVNLFKSDEYTFDQLKENKVTSSMLLSWSATMDVAEDYEVFLKTPSSDLINGQQIFLNCSKPWFGPSCRLSFDSIDDVNINDVLFSLQRSKQKLTKNSKATCYEHLHCETFSFCLDWREICDRKLDCLDGSDERNCWKLEINQCSDDEFRCSNGLCIPMMFFRDNIRQPDCLDRSDEIDPINDLSSCYLNFGFNCDESSCTPDQNDFPCGDGECTNGLRVCSNGRRNLSPKDLCSNATGCLLNLNLNTDRWCASCSKSKCIQRRCPPIFEFTALNPIYGHVRLLFSKNIEENSIIPLPQYICFAEKLCQGVFFVDSKIGNFTCRRFNVTEYSDTDYYDDFVTLYHDIRKQFRKCLPTEDDIRICNHSNSYKCQYSNKCISQQRLLDGFQDCPWNDDEKFNQSCQLPDVHQRYVCHYQNQNVCLPLSTMYNRINNCGDGIDELSEEEFYRRTQIDFLRICDSFLDLLPILIDGKNETDETNCHHWPCDNIYTRCDQFWHCVDGADEANCLNSLCPAFQHPCVFLNDTSKISCLPIQKAGDGRDDCLGGTDEQTKYRKYDNIKFYHFFHCQNDTQTISYNSICDRISDCVNNDDEVFCQRYGSPSFPLCPDLYIKNISRVDELLCRHQKSFTLKSVIYSAVKDIIDYPQSSKINTISQVSTKTNFYPTKEKSKFFYSNEKAWMCYRGIPINIRINKTQHETGCLCPPSYYGDLCQWQNQRVSLTVQIQVSFEWEKIFKIFISLIDMDGNIQSYDDFEYLGARDCDSKFNIYLLYSKRPKDLSILYSVRIDVYQEATWVYRASWLYPLQFDFLPVHRLSVFLKIPPAGNLSKSKECSPQCVHGRCSTYINYPNISFCQCSPGWSGFQCNIQHECRCHSNSLCISDSICLCSSNYFGSRCFFVRDACDAQSCQNGGQCISADIRHQGSASNSFSCLCTPEYSGKTCQYRQPQTQIDINFDYNKAPPTSILVHFIYVTGLKQPNRTTNMKKIPIDQSSLTIYTSSIFNLVFAQIFDQYYSLVIRERSIENQYLSTTIMSSRRCLSVRELVNDTFASQHLLRKVKYYHDLCKQSPGLLCFYDENHLCLCTIHRQANCIKFDHNVSYDCRGENPCENGGFCFLDDMECPQASFCACPRCYFGSRCQFSSKGAGTSLDVILGYHIRQKASLTQQSILIKVSVIILLFVFLIGFANGWTCYFIFRSETASKVGCGIYLYASSICTLLITMSVTIKFIFLLTLQMEVIKNRTFSTVQCLLLDFTIRSLLWINDWLGASVSFERAVNVLQGASFNKKKSRTVAKTVILIVCIVNISLQLFDPLNRHIVDDPEEKRTWCIAQYSSQIKNFEWIVTVTHIVLIFLINLFSAVTVVIVVARKKSRSMKTKSYLVHLSEQLHHHKHLLISSALLVIFAVPRVIRTFISACMHSAHDSHIYFIGYLIPFIPSITSFFIFVLPSNTYKTIFRSAIRKLWMPLHSR